MRQSRFFSQRLLGGILLCIFTAETQAATIYVDGKLAADCKGTYSLSQRDASGTDSDAYNRISKAAAAARAGDTVLIRGGTYNINNGKEDNDVLWPKNSGEAGNPIVFSACKDETVVLGDVGKDYPFDEVCLARGTITLKDVKHIVIENLTVKNVGGWLFGRGCNHITLRNCIFEDGLNGGKGGVKFFECTDSRVLQCTFKRSAADSLVLQGKCDRFLVEGNDFYQAFHCLLAIRGSSFVVVRNNRFVNPIQHLTEAYDTKPGHHDAPNDPMYFEHAFYDSTQHHLYEQNFFGFEPTNLKRPAQYSAMEYSGQRSIIRRNVYCNPSGEKLEGDTSDQMAGGVAIGMRWGGSWDGWSEKKKCWIGEGIEAGFVTHNRIYHNTMLGFSAGCVQIPDDKAVSNLPNPPPMECKNPPAVFTRKYEFEDNIFKNNIIVPATFEARTTWAWQKVCDGKPAGILVLGLLKAVRFECNDIFGGNSNELIYVGSPKYPPPASPSAVEAAYPETFVGNLQKEPLFVDQSKHDFRLQEKSPLIDVAAFLTAANGDGSGKVLCVKDVSCFFDGFGIEGEKGDVIQLAGDTATARILSIDIARNEITLDQPLTWKTGQGVSLAYAGAAPDVGALEHGAEVLIGNRILGGKTKP